MGFCVFCIHTGPEHSGSLDGLERGPNKKLRESLFVFYCLKLFFKGFYFQNLCEKIRPVVLNCRQFYPQGTPGNIWRHLCLSYLVEEVGGSSWHLWARLGVLLNALQHMGQPPPQRITRPQVSVVLWLKPFSSLSHLDEIITLHRSNMWRSLLPAHTQAPFGVIWPMLSTLLSALPHAPLMQHKSLTAIYHSTFYF